jgi:hypothetical protein
MSVTVVTRVGCSHEGCRRWRRQVFVALSPVTPIREFVVAGVKGLTEKGWRVSWSPNSVEPAWALCPDHGGLGPDELKSLCTCKPCPVHDSK